MPRRRSRRGGTATIVRVDRGAYTITLDGSFPPLNSTELLRRVRAAAVDETQPVDPLSLVHAAARRAVLEGQDPDTVVVSPTIAEELRARLAERATATQPSPSTYFEVGQTISVGGMRVIADPSLGRNQHYMLNTDSWRIQLEGSYVPLNDRGEPAQDGEGVAEMRLGYPAHLVPTAPGLNGRATILPPPPDPSLEAAAAKSTARTRYQRDLEIDNAA